MENNRPHVMVVREWPADLDTCGVTELDVFLLTPRPQEDKSAQRELWARDGEFGRAWGVIVFPSDSEHARSDVTWHRLRVHTMPAPDGQGMVVYAIEHDGNPLPVRGL